MTEPEGWIELSFGYDKDSAKSIAQAKLATIGVSPDDLTPEELRMDIGRDADGKEFYRIRALVPALAKLGRNKQIE